MGTYPENMAFEAEARRIAEVVWGLEPGACQPMHYPSDPVVKEIDGIARLRDVTHLLMVTTSTRLDKTKDQIKKLNAAESLEKKNAPAVSKWIITERQLDAEHIELARKNGIAALTLIQFRQRFFDGKQYIALRSKYAFGSARDPRTDSITINEGAYVELPMRIAFDRANPRNNGASITLEGIATKISEGDTIVLRAPFGSGKSLTTREIFKMLSKKHQYNSESAAPLCLNLREHWGEAHSDEMLDRHARVIGYKNRVDVVIAWRAGMCSLLLDGFDEVASQSVVRIENKNFMREARRQALKGVRDFTSKLPAKVGVFLCGRDHYFDDVAEMLSSLGLSNPKLIIIDLGEFDEGRAIEFLRRNGATQELPDWLPRKPLILSYLLRENLLDEIVSIDGSKGFGHAWDTFLNRICDREAALDEAVMDPGTLRAVLERLAQLVRCRASGTGPISGTDLAQTYAEETGQTAGEGVLAQLQRLPGLTQRDAETSARSFVDHDMLSALQGSALANSLLTRFEAAAWVPLDCLSERAIEMAAHVLRKSGAGVETVLSAISRLTQLAARERVSAQHVADCLALAAKMAADADESELDFKGLLIDGAALDRIALDDVKLRGVTFQNCTVRELLLAETARSEAHFKSCIIGRIVGAASKEGVPASLVSADCEIGSFDNLSTNSAVLSSDAPAQVKALLTVLRKLYKQAGSGRKLSAFSRGITKREVQSFIEPCIDLLRKHQFVSVFNQVVHPVRKQSSRVEAILAAPSMSTDAVVVEARALR